MVTIPDGFNHKQSSLLKEESMLQKFKITSCAFILVLFGCILKTVSPVLAVDGDGFTVCDNMPEAADELSCFRDLARSLRAEVEDMTTAASSQEAAVDDAEGTKEALKLQIEEINEWLEEKDARIADLTDRLASFEQSQAEFDATIAELQEQLSTASSESQAKEETIADLTDRLAAAMDGSTQGGGAGTASDNKHLNGEGPQEHFWPCTRGGFSEMRACMAGELTEWRDGCEGTFEAMRSPGSIHLCREELRKAGRE